MSRKTELDKGPDGGDGSTRLRFEQICRERRRHVAAIKVFGYLCIPVVSFFVTLFILQYIEQSDDLKRAALSTLYKEVELAQSNATPTVSGLRVFSPSARAGDTHLPDRAFDQSQNPDSFWEAEHFPVDLVVILPKPQILNAYTISAQELTNRMPKSWILEGSREGLTWITLDQQEGVKSWQLNEARNYRIDTVEPVAILRFQFQAGFDLELLRIYEIAIR